MARTDEQPEPGRWVDAAHLGALAEESLEGCDIIAGFTEEPGRITRTFLCPSMHDVHQHLTECMRAAGMSVRVDAVGNLIGRYPPLQEPAPVFLIGSHLDTVPNAGKYDGILGVVLGVGAVKALAGRRLPFAVEVLGFSEEEGIRFRKPYLGSLAVTGRFDPHLLQMSDSAGITLGDAIRNFGLELEQIPRAAYPTDRVLGYLETHIEQGPILADLNMPVGVVEAIVGQTRLWLIFEGNAGHAGTLPMDRREDALTAAAEFVLEVEQLARITDGLRGTVGQISVDPGVVNVVPGNARLSVDIRHADDSTREAAVRLLLQKGEANAAKRGVRFHLELESHQQAVPADPRLTDLLAGTTRDLSVPFRRMVSGAGHDAVIMAALTPWTMLFVRSPNGISHHPDETVLPDDIMIALEIMVHFLFRLAGVSR